MTRITPDRYVKWRTRFVYVDAHREPFIALGVQWKGYGQYGFFVWFWTWRVWIRRRP